MALNARCIRGFQRVSECFKMAGNSISGLHGEIKPFQSDCAHAHYVKLSAHVVSRIRASLNERLNYEGASQPRETQPTVRSSRAEMLIAIHGRICVVFGNLAADFSDLTHTPVQLQVLFEK